MHLYLLAYKTVPLKFNCKQNFKHIGENDTTALNKCFANAALCLYCPVQHAYISYCLFSKMAQVHCVYKLAVCASRRQASPASFVPQFRTISYGN